MSKVTDLLRKVLYVLHINPKCLVNFINSKEIIVDDDSIRNAYLDLEKLSANPNTSCITKNQIEKITDIHFIVPAYNAEKYIKQCIDSIVLPEKKISYHLTVINDGSTDNTAKILSCYEKIPEVEIITQSNKGHSGARNAGLKQIKGKYICFVDSDDYISWDGVEAMYQMADSTSADLVLGNYYVTDENGRVYNKNTKNKEKNYTGHPCMRIFKAELWEQVCFPEHYWFEDSVVKQVIDEKVKVVKKCSEYVYYYRQNPNSISHTSKKQLKAIDSLWVTIALHHDRERLDFSMNLEYYEYILLMTYLTYFRTKELGEDVLKNEFIIFCDFIEKYFGNSYNATKSYFKPIEKYVRNKDFKRWKLYCELLKIY